ncbi:MAG: polysaccharide pyruvyl transferase family protein [Clostridium sp.]|nr:polysaccharide pyruvyl transferase family protein [Clostridium sp.]
MKYGRIIHLGTIDGIDTSTKRLINLGDIWETMALDNCLKRLGIKENDIIECPHYGVENYAGEYIVTPINLHTYTLNYSNRILPVFIGLSFNGQHELNDKEEKVLQRFSPVGCRDERTLRMLLDKGIDAYLNGCMVATFPQRIQNLPTQDTVFLADANKAIMDYIPHDLLKKYKFIYHETYMKPDELAGGNLSAYGEMMKDLYSREAKLVITSRFHSAIMCLALGIPVILTIENFNFKYTWLRKYIPVYEPADFDKINWSPPAVTIPDEEKELMIRIACDKIKAAYDKYYDICTLSELRENIEIKEFDDLFYGNFAIEYIKKNWEKNTTIRYAYWGATYTAKRIQKFIEEYYPNAQLCYVYDMFVTNMFLDKVPRHPDNIETDEPAFIFVTSNTAIAAARDKFTGMNKPDSEFFMCERQFMTQEDINQILHKEGQ